MANLLSITCFSCNTENQSIYNFCVNCGASLERTPDDYTTEPLDPSLVSSAKKPASIPAGIDSSDTQVSGWKSASVQQINLEAVTRTLAEAVLLWQWLWFHYGQHPMPAENTLDTSLSQILAQLIENHRLRLEALHNLLIIELCSKRY